MGYPRKRDAMPDEWLDCEEALQKALHELGMHSVVVEARNNGTPGSDLLVVSFSFFIMLVDFDDGTWVIGLPSIGGEGKEWFGDLTGFKNITPRMLAIQVVARARLFFMRFIDFLTKIPPESRKDIEVDQALLFEIARADVSARTLGHWTALDENTPEDEEIYLTAFAQSAQLMVKQSIIDLGIDVPLD